MSTPSEREAALRRALLSAAEQIEPAPGGLERIQARLGRPRPVAVAWLEAAWTYLVMRAPVVIDAVRRQATKAWTYLVMRAPVVIDAVRRQARNVLRLVVERFGPGARPGAGAKRLSQLRPLAAMSVAVFVLGAGIYVALASPASIFQTGGNATGPLTGGGPPSASPGPRNTPTTFSNGSHHASSGPAKSSASPSPTCARGLRPVASSTPSGQSISPAPPVSSSSPISSPSPTPSETTTPVTGGSTPASSGNTAASPAAAGQASVAGQNATSARSAGSATSKKSVKSVGASPSASAKDLPGNNSAKYPCGSGHHKRHRKASLAADSAGRLTSAESAVPRPGGAAKLD